jgi:ATP-binding cassette, subfamily B, bacterial PglK
MIFSSFKKILDIVNLKTKNLIFLVFASSIFSIFFETLSIGMVIPLISAVTNPDYFNEFPVLKDLTLSFMENDNYESKIIFLLIIISLIFFLKVLFVLLSIYLKLKLVHDFNSNLQKTLFSKYLNLNWSQYLKKKSSKMIRNIQNESSILKNKIVDAIVIFFVETLLFISIIILLVFTIPKITLSILALIIFIGAISYKFIKKKINEFSKARLSSGAKIFNYIIESLFSFKDIFIYNKQLFFQQKFNKQNDIYHVVQKNLGLLNSLPRVFLESLGYIAIISVMYISIKSNLSKQELITTLGLFVVAITRLIPTISKIIVSIQNLNEGQVALDNIHNEVTEYKISSNNPLVSSNKQSNFKNSIVLNNINFAYPDKEYNIVENLSLSIKKNSSNAIFGPSGSGKSTLIDLISGLHEPNSGKIIIDGKLIKNLKDFWGNNISYVGQKNYMISDDLVTNITLQSELSNEDIEKVKEIIDFCSLHKFNLFSKINEMGINLSGGESQRISIARALYNNPSFLIFDEATNSLDKKIENEILELLISLKSRTTLLLISHEKNVVDYCDNIFELKNKKLDKIK